MKIKRNEIKTLALPDTTLPLWQSNSKEKHEYSLNSREKICFGNSQELTNHNSVQISQRRHNMAEDIQPEGWQPGEKQDKNRYHVDSIIIYMQLNYILAFISLVNHNVPIYTHQELSNILNTVNLLCSPALPLGSTNRGSKIFGGKKCVIADVYYVHQFICMWV